MHLLKDDRLKMTFIDHLKLSRERSRFRLLGFVIMPNHVHLVILPAQKSAVGRIIGELKSRSARDLVNILRTSDAHLLERISVERNGRHKYAFWQRRCFDHNCRNEATTIEKVEYCHNNPVRSGLVDDPEKWRWSSYASYAGHDDAVIEIDELVSELI